MASIAFQQLEVSGGGNKTASSSISAPSAPGTLRFDGFAVVVFTEQTRIWWLQALRPGFRHCCVYRQYPGGWLLLDPLCHRLAVAFQPEIQIESNNKLADALELAASLRLAGQMAVTLPIRQPPERLAPPLPFSCVELVKRVIGIKSYIICTPWQLFRELRKYSLDDSLILNYTSNQQEQKVYIARKRAVSGPWFIIARRLLRGAFFGRASWPDFSATPRRRR